MAALQRICEPGPKTDVAAWYSNTILPALWRLPAERFTSQAFWECFDHIHLGPLQADAVDRHDELDRAQGQLLGLWKAKRLVGPRLLSYDATNFHTFVASTNDRNTIARRGHNRQGRHNLRQVGLSYVLDGTHGLSLYHHVYPGNLTGPEEFSTSLPRLLQSLDDHQIARDSVTLVFDKGAAALANTLALDQSGIGWVSALPWNQAPPACRDMLRAGLRPEILRVLSQRAGPQSEHECGDDDASPAPAVGRSGAAGLPPGALELRCRRCWRLSYESQKWSCHGD